MMVALQHIPPTTQSADTLARGYLLALQRGESPVRPDAASLGRWARVCNILDIAKGDGEAVQRAVRTLIAAQKFPGLADLLAPAPAATLPGPDRPRLYLVDTYACPPLPEGIAFPSEVSAGACPWLDQWYVPFSREASPEAYDDFHVFCGLWTLSVVNARRVYLPLQRKRVHGNLMIALCADTSMFAKSTTADVAKDVLREAGLGYLLGADRITPAKLLSDMGGKWIPNDYDELPSVQQERIRQRLAMAGQHGLFYDEFGKFVQGMLRKGSGNADFADIFLQLDACPAEYEASTITRGAEPVKKPYLPLLGAMTYANLKDNAKSGADFWTDGFWARFSFVAAQGKPINGPLDAEELPIPDELTRALRQWHIRLGVPQCRLIPVEKNGEPTGKYTIEREELAEQACTITQEAHQAWSAYRSALRELCFAFPHKDFHGNYARLPETALRMAVLMASLENNNRIELRHWARAQELAEVLRHNLHELYQQINTLSSAPTPAATLENEVLRHMIRLTEKGKGPFSATDLSAYMPSYARKDIEEVLKTLTKLGVASREVTSRTTKYSLTEQQPAATATTGQTDAAEADW